MAGNAKDNFSFWCNIFENSETTCSDVIYFFARQRLHITSVINKNYLFFSGKAKCDQGER
jgi:hypothetical protein